MAAPAEIRQKSVSAEEDRILRLWTPILLRTILTVAMIALVSGLVLTATFAPGYFVDRYAQAELGNLMGRETLSGIWSNIVAGEPHAVLMLGLFALTLVPLARVAFCFLLFLKERDYTYVAFTAYVLAGLIFGVLLGRVG
jgi:uncharacterized membrane protein